MKHKTKFKIKTSVILILVLSVFQPVFAQVEIEPWGQLRGIRIDGQLMEFESNITVVKSGWSDVKVTAKERQRPKYVRNGNQQIVTTNIDSIYLTKTVEDAGKGNAKVNVQVAVKADETLEGVYVGFSVPATYYANGTVQANNAKAFKIADVTTTALNAFETVKSLQFKSADRQLQLVFDEPTAIIVKNNAVAGSKGVQYFIPIATGNLAKGQTASKSFTIHAQGRVDRTPIKLALNTTQAGRVFDGLGGNFRLQNPRTDPQVIDYSLKNLRVAWGRAEMPWRFWQPSIDTNPIIAAKAGRLPPQVKNAMEMAQRLYKVGMPLILSAWSAPSWAIVGPPRFRPGPDNVWGNPLDQAKTNEIYKSIADYLVYLKDEYGTEVDMFSFNESDLGINIRQTGQEHAKLIKELGAYFASRGLKTKLLLGDNSDAITYEFIYPAMNDPETHPYIGAISFHSWRGWTNEILQKWADAATKLNKTLIVGEGSIDAQAWGYPLIFQEQTYALEEINLYTRLLAICQPASILQWQLTADYSPLAGGGIFGDTGRLRPIQRFWNLKQLSLTPPGLKAMLLITSAPYLSGAALGDNDKGTYAIHLVNTGASRVVTLTGLPAKVRSLSIMVTDKQRSIKEGTPIPVVNGQAKFVLDETSYTTLISK